MNASDYLLKPIDPKELILAIESVKTQHTKSNNHYENNLIRIPTINGFLLCNVNDILYCQANGRYTEFYLENGKVITSSRNLGDYDFSDTSLLRIHRSHVVNIYKIAEYFKGKAPYILLHNKTQLNVSSHYKDELLSILEKV